MKKAKFNRISLFFVKSMKYDKNLKTLCLEIERIVFFSFSAAVFCILSKKFNFSDGDHLDRERVRVQFLL